VFDIHYQSLFEEEGGDEAKQGAILRIKISW
jgi:hypothetical protein